MVRWYKSLPSPVAFFIVREPTFDGFQDTDNATLVLGAETGLMPSPLVAKMPPEKTLSQREAHFTLRNPPYMYLRLSVRTFPSGPGDRVPAQTMPSLDEITIHQYVTSALRFFLGITGTAIPIDILKVCGNEAWVRVPREDGQKVIAAISCWSGKGGQRIGVEVFGSWLGGLSRLRSEDRRKLWSLEI